MSWLKLPLGGSIAIGIALGVLTADVGKTWWRSVLMYYDDAKPVVIMTGKLVGRTEDGAVLVHMQGHKMRNCAYLRMQAYTRDIKGALTDAYARREDRMERGDTKPIGEYDIGTWRIWPVGAHARTVEVFIQHDCDGRIVSTRIAEVPLS